MAFDDDEISVEGSNPLELFRFRIDTETFRYTTQEKAYVYDGTYTPLALTRSPVTQGQDSRKDTFELQLPGDNPFALKYVNMIPGSIATVDVFRVQRGVGVSDIQASFSGEVQAVGWIKDATVAVVSAMSEIGSALAPMPRKNFGSGCGHVHYDPLTCRVLKTGSSPGGTPFRFNGAVTVKAGYTGNVLTVPGAAAFGDGWFTSGTLSADSGADVRHIRSHVGDVLTVHAGFPFEVLGADVVLQAGCGHVPTVCALKFANFPNYGGCHAVPDRNVFVGGLR